MLSIKEKIEVLKNKAKDLSPEQIIELTYVEFGNRVNFATSLGEEDQIILDMISKVAPKIDVFTLDTGRLHHETYDLLAKNQKKYRINFKIFYPDTTSVEKMVRDKGINLFYESFENRKLCCGVRKVEPLRRALKNVDAWICGLRREQTVTRSHIEIFDWDENNQKIKISPIAFWTMEDVHKYINENNVDVNPLHAKGYMSIGCAPCTRAVKPGEDIRAGRWWWEAPEQKGCGLHIQNGKLIRGKNVK